MTWRTIGFPKIKSFFENSVARELLNHAYLFTGQEMIGKRTFALELAELINSIPDDNSGRNRLYLDPETSESGRTIGIGEVRQIKKFLSLSVSRGVYKLVIINDAYCLTDEAQNALLKILEEPGLLSMFILITDKPTSLLSTIISRCQEIKFQPHSSKTVMDYFNNLNLPPAKADFLVKFCNGRLGLAKNIIENNSFEEIKKDIEQFTSLSKSDLNGRFTIAQEMTDEKEKEILSRKILFWILFLQLKPLEPNVARIQKNLLVLHQRIQQPQLNARLALEEFLINL